MLFKIFQWFLNQMKTKDYKCLQAPTWFLSSLPVTCFLSHLHTLISLPLLWLRTFALADLFFWNALSCKFPQVDFLSPFSLHSKITFSVKLFLITYFSIVIYLPRHSLSPGSVLFLCRTYHLLNEVDNSFMHFVYCSPHHTIECKFSDGGSYYLFCSLYLNLAHSKCSINTHELWLLS